MVVIDYFITIALLKPNFCFGKHQGIIVWKKLYLKPGLRDHFISYLVKLVSDPILN